MEGTGQIHDRVGVASDVDEVRLLTYAEVARLFPDCGILRERFWDLRKSYIAVRL